MGWMPPVGSPLHVSLVPTRDGPEMPQTMCVQASSVGRRHYLVSVMEKPEEGLFIWQCG